MAGAARGAPGGAAPRGPNDDGPADESAVAGDGALARDGSPAREAAPAGDGAPALSLRGIGVSYGPVVAVDGVDLDLARGEILALCGDNGAGKSSLIKVVSGALAPSRGEIRLGGEAVRFEGPLDALSKGVATIYQELALAPRLAIWQNVFLGAELTRRRLGVLRVLDRRRMIDASRGYLRRLALDVDDVQRPVERLSGGQRQAVAIARALHWDARIVVMDEPTAALGVRETAQVLDLVRRLRDEGRAVLLISHSMHEVVEVATRVVVLRHGRKIADRTIDGLAANDLARIIETGVPQTSVPPVTGGMDAARH